MTNHTESELINEYIKTCGSHCVPYIIIKNLDTLPEEWTENHLSQFINTQTKQIGCIDATWKLIQPGEERCELASLLTKSRMLEAPPFYGGPIEKAAEFVNSLFSFIGEGTALTNRITHSRRSSSYSFIFPEDDEHALDLGIAIITGEWFAFIAHRGRD